MNLILKVIISFLIFSNTCIAQDREKSISEAWVNLKTQLQRRTDIVANVAKVLSKSKQVDQEQLNKAKILAIELFNFTDTSKALDSIIISFANELNTNLTQALTRTLVTLEQDQGLRNSTAVRDLLLQLEAIENRIMVARRDYNDLCSDNNKKELLFGSNTNDNPPKVKF